VLGAIVVALGVVGYGGYFGYRALFSGDMPSRVATSEPPSSTAPAPEPPKDASAAPQPPAQDSTSMPSMPPTPPDSEAKPTTKDAAKDATTTGMDSTKAPGTSPATKDASKAQPAKSATPAAAPGSTAPTTDATKAAAATKSQPSPTAQPDRWQLMKESMARCAGETFFKRVACEQAVGLQYCEGYWGKVPQCPSGPPKDRGQ
jgi:hypothetical protein